MSRLEQNQPERPFSSPAARPAPVQSTTRQASPWQKALLSLMLLSFLGASYAFLQSSGSNQADRLPPILFLAEDESGTLQLFTASEPEWQARQLTTETAEILSFAASPNGSQLAYSTRLPDGSSSIKLLKLQYNRSGATEAIFSCADAECRRPVWHPDGHRLLYERREPPNFNRPQLWWLDSETGQSILLFEEESAIGSNASFSHDGQWVSFATIPEAGIRLYNFVDGRSFMVPSNVGTPATWHPLRAELLFQNSRSVVFHGENNDNHMEHAHDFANAVSLYFAEPGSQAGEPTPQLLSTDGAFNDGNPAWSPDGEWIAFGRRLAQTGTGRQLWLMRADGSDAQPLTDELAVHYGPPDWSPDGRFLLFQRYDSNHPETPPSIWLYDLAEGQFNQIVIAGMLPTWLHTTQP